MSKRQELPTKENSLVKSVDLSSTVVDAVQVIGNGIIPVGGVVGAVAGVGAMATGKKAGGETTSI